GGGRAAARVPACFLGFPAGARGRGSLPGSRAPAPTAPVPPQNIEAEESVLGAMLVAEPTLTRVIDEVKLNASDFYLEKHATIFTAIHDLYAASKPVDELSVAEALAQHNHIDTAGGKPYLPAPPPNL